MPSLCAVPVDQFFEQFTQTDLLVQLTQILRLTELIFPKMLESRLETLLWGRNIVLICGITKPFHQNEVPCYACKEFRALKANFIFKVAYSLNKEQGTSFSGRV